MNENEHSSQTAQNYIDPRTTQTKFRNHCMSRTDVRVVPILIFGTILGTLGTSKYWLYLSAGKPEFSFLR